MYNEKRGGMEINISHDCSEKDSLRKVGILKDFNRGIYEW
jgi:hypothetical protein